MGRRLLLLLAVAGALAAVFLASAGPLSSLGVWEAIRGGWCRLLLATLSSSLPLGSLLGDAGLGSLLPDSSTPSPSTHIGYATRFKYNTRKDRYRLPSLPLFISLQS